MKKLFTICILGFFTSFYSTNAQMAHVPGEILVQFASGTDPEAVVAQHAMLNNRNTELTLEKLLSAPMNIYRLHFNPSLVQEDRLLAKLKSDPAITIAQFNHIVSRREAFPNDPQFGSQWHHSNTGLSGGTEGSDISSGLAWEITTGGLTALGDTIVVCVIEGGNLNHPDLTDNAWVNHLEIPDNDIDDDENGYVDDYFGWNVNSQDDNDVLQGGHGTAVMGMIGAKGDNDLGVVGANWNVKIMSVAGENLFNEASVVEAYTYPLVQRQLYDSTDGALGAFVVATNASWGIDNGNPDDVPIWSAFYDTLGAYGILNCGATANNNVNIDVVGDIPTAAPSDYMISVTATNFNDVRTFSAYGATTVDLGAPGENVFTTAGQDSYGGTSGTSFASPLTAGVIALLYSVPCESFAQFVKDDPQGAADYVRLALFEGVDPVPNLQGQTVTGGRLNAFNSLSILLSNCGEDICLPPLGFTYSVENDTVYTFSWSNFGSDSVTVRYRELGSEEWINLPELVDTTSFVMDSLGICVSYEFEIAAGCSEVDGELQFGSNQVIETLGCCEATTEMTTSDVTETTVDVAWSQSFNIGIYEVYYSLSGLSNWILAGAFEETNVTIEGLNGCTFYDILVKPACSADFADGIISTIRTKDCGICIDSPYCESRGESSFFEFIDQVEIGAYSNPSGNNDGFALFEETGLELQAGGLFETILTPGFAFASYSEFFQLWIDLNHDGEFSDDELLMSSTEGSSEAVLDTIAIPVDAMLGATRLRVAMKYVGNNNPTLSQCEVFEEGETEDYCVTITESSLSANNVNAFEYFSVFPNPGNGMFQIKYSLVSDMGSGPITADVFDATGKKVAQTTLAGGRGNIDLTHLENGLYVFHLSSQNAQILKTGKLVLLK
jgi:hypothetical protein